jgi:glycosyltransferase involved in cell wall biosynthesis
MLPPFLLSMMVACIRVARSADVLHANWSVNGAVAGLAGRITRTPIVTTLRGEDVTRAEHSALDRLLLRLTLRWSAQVATVADGLAAELDKRIRCGRERVMLIPNGVDDSFLAIKRKPDTKSGQLKLVFVGSLIARKSVDSVLKAMAKSCSTGSTSLAVAGDGPERHKLEALAAKLGLRHMVHFTGMLPANAIPALLREADALVLASCTMEVVVDDETGLLFQPGDVETLAAQIVRLRDDPALRMRMGRAGRAFVIDNGLSWRETGRRYTELYHRVVNEA